MRVFARVATTGPSKMTAGKQAGMTKVCAFRDNRNMELRQRLLGLLFSHY